MILALLLQVDLAWSGDELVVADKVVRVGERSFGEPRDITSIAVGDAIAEAGGRAGRGGRVAVWNREGKLLWELKIHRDLVYDLAWSGKRLYTAGGDGKIGVIEDGKEVGMLEGHAGPVLSLAVSREGQLASGSSDRSIRIWKDGKCVREIRNHSGRVAALAFAPDGRLASGSADGTVRIWHSEGRLLRIIRDHDGEVLSLAWGEVLVSGCSDGKVRILDAEGASAKIVRSHGDWVTSVAVSGRRVISADASGRVER